MKIIKFVVVRFIEQQFKLLNQFELFLNATQKSVIKASVLGISEMVRECRELLPR
ncbi:MAG: hypothetical protein ABIK67_01950 [candidate division WOR-3 bacterium]